MRKLTDALQDHAPLSFSLYQLIPGVAPDIDLHCDTGASRSETQAMVRRRPLSLFLSPAHRRHCAEGVLVVVTGPPAVSVATASAMTTQPPPIALYRPISA